MNWGAFFKWFGVALGGYAVGRGAEAGIKYVRTNRSKVVSKTVERKRVPGKGERVVERTTKHAESHA